MFLKLITCISQKLKIMVYLRVGTTNLHFDPEIVIAHTNNVEWLLDGPCSENDIIGYLSIKDPNAAKYVLECITANHKGQELPSKPEEVDYQEVWTVLSALEVHQVIIDKIGIKKVNVPVDLFVKYMNDIGEIPEDYTHIQFCYKGQVLDYILKFITEHNKGSSNLPRCTNPEDVMLMLHGARLMNIKEEYITQLLMANKFD